MKTLILTLAVALCGPALANGLSSSVDNVQEFDSPGVPNPFGSEEILDPMDQPEVLFEAPPCRSGDTWILCPPEELPSPSQDPFTPLEEVAEPPENDPCSAWDDGLLLCPDPLPFEIDLGGGHDIPWIGEVN